jgi:hypothetical protein
VATRESAHPTRASGAAADTSHPAPHRDRVPGWQIALGLFGGPAAWSAQSMLDAGLAGYSCFPKDEPLRTPLWAGLDTTLLTLNLVAIAVCIVSALIAWRAYRLTGEERPGSAHHLLESGDGRTRFLAFAGVMTSVLFIVAVAFETVEIFMVSPCHG